MHTELTLGGEPPKDQSTSDATPALGVSSLPGVTCTPSPFFPYSVATRCQFHSCIPCHLYQLEEGFSTHNMFHTIEKEALSCPGVSSSRLGSGIRNCMQLTYLVPWYDLGKGHTLSGPGQFSSRCHYTANNLHYHMG